MKADRSATSRALALAAVLGALAATVGDILLLAAARVPMPAIASVAERASALQIGSHLGVLGIPLYAFGYIGLARGLAPAAPRLAALVAGLGIACAALGAAIHGMTALAIRLAEAEGFQGSPIALVRHYGGFLIPLWGLLATAAAIASLAYARAILRGGSAFPRWMAAVNPITLWIAACSISAPFPTWRAVVHPAGPNLVHVPFFLLVALLLSGSRPARPGGDGSQERKRSRQAGPGIRQASLRPNQR